MRRALLTIDAGNTTVGLALVRPGLRVRPLGRVPTDRLTERALLGVLRHARSTQIEAVVLASVVPAATRFVAARLSRLFASKCLVAGKDLAVPVRNLYRNPAQVGADRLMNAVAVHRLYRRNAVVIDLGTATTFDVVTRQGEYLGGVIAPGIEISLEALYANTALLPKIRMAHPSRVVGRDTVGSIRSGCAWGMGGLCERIVGEICKERRFKKPLVVATGGYAGFLKRYYSGIEVVEPNLVHKGLALTYGYRLGC